MKTIDKQKKISNRVKEICVGVVVGILIGCVIGWMSHKVIYNITHKEPDISVEYVTGKLENIGELATQELTYTSSVPVENGKIPFITKKGFVMYYNATIKSGIEMEDMTVNIKNQKVIVSVPQTKILGTPNIDPDSLKFADEKKAILNWNTKDDVKEALKLAKEDFESNPNVDVDGIINKGNENLETIIHSLLDDSVGDMEVEVVFEN